MSSSHHLLGLSLPDLESFVVSSGFPAYRARQIYDWVHAKHVDDYDAMTNVPKNLRTLLADTFPFAPIEVLNRRVSSDGTRKYILKLSDGSLIETVGIPTYKGDGTVDRLTVCFSTQVGCPMECVFCATGKEGFTRNLTQEEIVRQIDTVSNDFKARVSNIVAMGQGEPFLNYDEVLAAIRELNSEAGYNIGARHITISTCGVVDGIERFSDEPEQFTLAISLHSAIQETRDFIMPKMKAVSLTKLRQTLLQYVSKTNRRVTFEYLLIRDVNDSDQHLNALIDYCRPLLCHINLLAMNDIEGSNLKATESTVLQHWQRELGRAGIEATVRNSRGSDIDGACGQLKNSFRHSS